MMKVLTRQTIVFLLGISIGFLVFWFFVKPEASKSNTVQSNDYPLLAKRIFVENPNDTKINFSSLRNAYDKYFEDKKIAGSLYFEYLPTGTSIRVNGDKEYSGASLLKVPVAMEAYKAQELGLIKLGEKIKIKPEWLNSEFGELYKKGAGYELTYEEALKIMLKKSDNTALMTLSGSVNPKLTQTTPRAFDSLDIDMKTETDKEIIISPRSYSSFLKCLYFSCYNTKEDSQKILEDLTETDFDNRINSGIGNKNIKVAHKIGVFNEKVQSDCGIIYLPSNNYVLCIMLEGKDDKSTDQTFQELSKMTFTFFE